MHLSVISSALAAAFCLAATPGHATAQAPAQSTAVAPTVSTIVPAKWDARPVGTYNVEIMLNEGPMAVRLTVSEVDGKLMGNFLQVDQNDSHDMSVTVKDSDLVFDADAPKGHVQIVLQHENDRISGRWSMGPDKGALRGTIAR